MRERLWWVTPGGVLSVLLLVVLLAGCAHLPENNLEQCLRGSAAHAETGWQDPMDTLITRAIDEGRESWCAAPLEPAVRQTRLMGVPS